MTYKLLVQNSKVVLKTLQGVLLNIIGIKDSFTGTGSVTNNLINWKLLHYTDTAANLALLNPVLGPGQIAFTSDLLYTGTNQPRYKVGNGTDTWSVLDYVPEGGGSSETITTEVFIYGTDVLTLAHTQIAIISVHAGQSALFLTDDYTIAGSTFTITSSFVGNGDKIRITYTY